MASLLRRDRLFWVAVLVVACFVAVLLLPSQSRASYPSYFLAILMLATVVSWRDVFRLPAVWLVIGLLGWMALSTLWSEDWSLRDAISVWVRCLLVFLFVIAVAECLLRGQLQRWMTHALMLVGVAAVSAAIIVFYATNPADGRLNGLGQLDTHVIAALVYGVVLLFVLRFCVETAHRWQQIAGACVALLVCVAVFLSDSRNAWVSLLVGATVFCLAHGTRDVRRFVTLISVVAVALLLAMVGILNTELGRELLLPRGDSFRIEIWSQFIQKLQSNWWFGHGILTNDDLVVDSIVFHHPHSMYLSVVFQAGLIALIMYLAVIAWTLVTLVRNYSSADAKLALSILALALSAHLLDGHELVDKVGSSWFLIWLPVAIAIGLRWSEPDFAEADDD